MTVRLGAITFANGLPDADGDRFKLTELDGWEFPEVDVEFSERHGDGLYVARRRLRGRPITLSGSAVPQTGPVSTSRTWRLRKKLAQVCDDLVRANGTLFVDEPALGFGPLQADVLLAERLRVRRLGPYAIEFEIPLLAPDPRKYSQTLKAQAINSVATAITNAGGFPTPLTATLDVAASNVWVQNNSDGNRRVTLNGAVAAGTVIDFAARTVTTAGGANVYSLVDPASKWFELRAGSNTIQTSGSWTIRWRDAHL